MMIAAQEGACRWVRLVLFVIRWRKSDGWLHNKRETGPGHVSHGGGYRNTLTFFLLSGPGEFDATTLQT